MPKFIHIIDTKNNNRLERWWVGGERELNSKIGVFHHMNSLNKNRLSSGRTRPKAIHSLTAIRHTKPMRASLAVSTLLNCGYSGQVLIQERI